MNRHSYDETANECLYDETANVLPVVFAERENDEKGINN